MAPNLAGKWISPMHPEVIRDEPGPCPVCGMPLLRTESLGYVAPSTGPETKPLVVPRSAVLVTGTRAVVYLQIKGKDEAPTFEGREIVLGPRAGDYYLVRSGLKKGDLVVTNGNFKLDSALQILAKPSMMTPEGGGSAGHDHGGQETKGSDNKDVAGKGQMKIPAAFHKQLAKLEQAYQEVTKAYESDDMGKIKKSFDQFGETLSIVDGKLLVEHPHMVWKELHMLLGNDVVIAQNMKQLSEAKRLWGEFEDHMRRLREQFGRSHAGHGVDVAAIPAEFHQQLGAFWKAYLPLQKALAADNFKEAQQSIPELRKALAGIDGKLLPGETLSLWEKEQKQMGKVLDELEKAKDLKAFRDHFSSLSGGLLATIQTFGLPNTGPVYQLHCSMAFNNRGAKWLQDTNQPRNPYFGEQMLTCASQIQIIAGSEKAKQGGEHHHE
jgi:Cu(I)/Ag(I) efflux system membrane fusion protein